MTSRKSPHVVFHASTSHTAAPPAVLHTTRTRYVPLVRSGPWSPPATTPRPVTGGQTKIYIAPGRYRTPYSQESQQVIAGGLFCAPSGVVHQAGVVAIPSN